LGFVKKALIGYLIFVVAMLALALLTLSVTSLIPSQNSSSYSPENLEENSKSIEVSWLSPEDQNLVSCTKYWNCTFVEVTSPSYCSALKLNFSILNGNTQAHVVAATSYSGEIYASTPTFVELGFNNLIEKEVLFSFPLVSCTEPLVLSSWETGMYDFPSSFCDSEYPMLCSKTGVTAQTWTSTDETDLYWNGGGSTVLCNDGWISNSGGKQGACSSHGGVAD
jgi:hypothetical protein